MNTKRRTTTTSQTLHAGRVAENAEILRETECVQKGILAIRPGYIVGMELSMTGGIKFRTDADGKMTKEADHPKLAKVAKAITNSAYYAATSNSVPIPAFGNYVDEDLKERFEAVLNEQKLAADEFNKLAERAESARRLRIDWYFCPVDVNDERLARRLAVYVRESLVELRNAIVEGDVSQFNYLYSRSRNLSSLAIGLQSMSIRAALEEVRALKPTKSGPAPGVEAMRQLDRTINMFVSA